MASSASLTSEQVVIALVSSERAREALKAVVEELGRRVEFLDSRKDLVRHAREARWVVLDRGEPPGEMLSLIRRLRRVNQDLLIAGMPGNPDPGVIDIFEAGASAVFTGESPAEAARLIRAAEAGKAIVDPDVAGALLRRVHALSQLCVDQRVDVSRCKALTGRERDIAALLAVRASNEAIAARLGIAVGTVKTHVHSILDKLDVDSRNLAGIYWRLYSGESKSAKI